MANRHMKRCSTPISPRNANQNLLERLFSKDKEIYFSDAEKGILPTDLRNTQFVAKREQYGDTSNIKK